eukprot:gene8080-9942_t
MVNSSKVKYNCKIDVKDLTLVTLPKGLVPDSVDLLSLNIFKQTKYFLDSNKYQNTLEEGSLPRNLKELRIEHILFKHNPRLIPESVEKIVIYSWSRYTKQGESFVLPENVKQLDILGSRDEFQTTLAPIPPSVSDLKLNLVEIDHPLYPGFLPESIKCLDINLSEHNFPLVVGSFPRKLERLKYRIPTGTNGSGFTVKGIIPDGVLPSELKTLDLYVSSLPPRITIPNSIQFLKLNCTYENPEVFESMVKLVTSLIAQKESRIEIQLIKAPHNYQLQDDLQRIECLPIL